MKRNRIEFKRKNENGYYKFFKRNKVFKINNLCTKYLYKHLNGIYRQSLKYQRIKKEGLKSDFTRSLLRIYGGKNGKYIYDKKYL